MSDRVLHHPRLVDGGMALISLGAVVDYLPAAASALAVLWYLVQLWESHTGERIRLTIKNLPNGLLTSFTRKLSMGDVSIELKAVGSDLKSKLIAFSKTLLYRAAYVGAGVVLVIVFHLLTGL